MMVELLYSSPCSRQIDVEYSSDDPTSNQIITVEFMTCSGAFVADLDLYEIGT